MKMYSAKLAGLAVVIGSILAIPAASAAEPVDISSNITIKSADSCELTVTHGSATVAMNYAVTSANVSAGTAGTYTLSGDSTADYTITAGGAACALGSMTIQMPVVGQSSGAYAMAMYKGATKFLVNTYVADLYATENQDGTGTPNEVLGASIALANGSGERTLSRSESGYAQSLTKYSTGSSINKPANIQAPISAPAVLSAVAHMAVSTAYNASAASGWPSGYNTGVTLNGSLIPVGFLNGAPGGSSILIPAASLTDQKSVTIKVGTAVSAFPYTQQVQDVGGVVNGEVFTGTGTLTVTSS